MSKSRAVLLSEELNTISQQISVLSAQKAEISKQLYKEIGMTNRQTTSVDLSTNVRKLGLSTRTVNCLVVEGIHTVFDVIQYSKKALLQVPSLGPMSVSEIEEILSAHDFLLKPQ